jgi:hypothetical protein
LNYSTGCNGGYDYATGCSVCPGGKYSSITDETCKDCEFGQYSNQAASKCIFCPVGTYNQDYLTATVCTNCWLRTYGVGDTGATNATFVVTVPPVMYIWDRKCKIEQYTEKLVWKRDTVIVLHVWLAGQHHEHLRAGTAGTAGTAADGEAAAGGGDSVDEEKIIIKTK